MCVKVENISLSDLKEMMQDIVTSSERVMLVELSSVKNQVDATLEQATKTNGRVNQLEDDVIVLEQTIKSDSKHRRTDCPHNEDLRVLKEEALTSSNRRRFIWATIIAASTIGALIGTLLGIIGFFVGS